MIAHPPCTVLNALRHQRGKQSSMFRLPAVLNPWVLNALRHQRGKQLPDCVQVITSNVTVLNALRHQRGKQGLCLAQSRLAVSCSTPCGIRGENNLSPRLIFASRECAQRLAASEGKTRIYSTRTRRGLCTVLNALRHQRGKQCQTSVIATITTTCSTPCGIRGENKLVAKFPRRT